MELVPLKSLSLADFLQMIDIRTISVSGTLVRDRKVSQQFRTIRFLRHGLLFQSTRRLLSCAEPRIQHQVLPSLYLHMQMNPCEHRDWCLVRIASIRLKAKNSWLTGCQTASDCQMIDTWRLVFLWYLSRQRSPCEAQQVFVHQRMESLGLNRKFLVKTEQTNCPQMAPQPKAIQY